MEAQACYSLGNTYTLLRDYEKAIEYHLRHLRIAQELRDRVGEGRACWSLGNAHTALGNHEQALQFASKHLQISKEIGDNSGEVTAQMNLADLKTLLGISCSTDRLPSDLDTSSVSTDRQSIASSYTTTDSAGTDDSSGRFRPRRFSMENMELVKMTPDKKSPKCTGTKPKTGSRLQKAATIAADTDVENRDPKMNGDMKKQEKGASGNTEEDDFFNLITKFQSRRLDEQRCSFRTNRSVTLDSTGISTSGKADEFLDMVAGIQGSRINDQRAMLPRFPGLNNSKTVIDKFLTNNKDTSVPDDDFFEMLMRCQGSRIEDQRSSLPPPTARAPTVPDEDFFSLIQRVQSSRLDEQRSNLPDPRNIANGAPVQDLAEAGKKKKNEQLRDVIVLI